MKIAPHAMIPLVAAVNVAQAISGRNWTVQEIREWVPVSNSGMVRQNDVMFLATGQFGFIGEAGNTSFDAGDLQDWDLSVPGTQRYISLEEVEEDLAEFNEPPDAPWFLPQADDVLPIEASTEKPDTVTKSDGPSLGRRVGNAIAGHFEYKRSLHRKS
jgi:hypothetical protein